jgi:hypothetical protein
MKQTLMARTQGFSMNWFDGIEAILRRVRVIRLTLRTGRLSDAQLLKWKNFINYMLDERVEDRKPVDAKRRILRRQA